jgi:rhamnosyltransferase
MGVDSVRIAAVVVLFNPAEDVVANIFSYSDQTARVYAVDNSDSPSIGLERRLAKLGNVEYLPQGENLGVAAALNIGAEKAINNGFDLLLTMDQDSRATPGMVAKMLRCLEGKDRVGIISPYHGSEFAPNPDCCGCEEVLTEMTSGNLLDLSVYSKVGSFLEEYFIDCVDDEYCLRLNAAGYRVIRCNDAILEHNLGTITAHRYRGRKILVANQNPLRRYYMTRNRFYVIKKYKECFPDYCRDQLANLRGEIKGIILFEDRKFLKLLNSALGYMDYLRGRTGKFRASWKRGNDGH